MTTRTTTSKKKQLFLNIGGMQCSFCVETVNKALHQLEGVFDSGVSLAHEEVYVAYDPTKIDESHIKDSLRRLGFYIRDPQKLKAFKQEQEELRHSRNLVLASGMIVLITTIMMTLSWLDIKHPVFPYVNTILAAIIIFGIGNHVLKMAWASARRRILNQHVLMEVGAIGGFLGGIAGFFIQPWPMMDFFAAAIFITAYHLLSGYVSTLVRTKTSESVMRLLKLQPTVARVRRNGDEVEIPVTEVQKGDVVIVKPGESIPVDGIVIEGASYVDLGLVTGEPLPAIKKEGDEVIGGAMNHDGVLLVKVTRVGEETFLYQVSRSIQQARTLKPGILLLVEKVLKFFVPGVLVAALTALLFWIIVPFLFTGQPDYYKAFFSALAVSVMGYPCALGMATPLAMIRGSGEAAGYGILLRSGEAFQSFKDVDTIVLDKTGTITKGTPAVSTIRVMSPTHEEREVVRIAAAIEQYSEHPIGMAITKHARRLDVEYQSTSVMDFENIPGMGAKATVDGNQVIIGNLRFLQKEHVVVTKEHLSLARDLEKQGSTVVGISKNGEMLGLIALSDPIKHNAKEIITKMKQQGFNVIMMTGDNRHTADIIARSVGINHVFSELLPQDKAQKIRELQRDGRVVAMVGDGINDAPALTQANVGIAMAAGTDIAMESADIIIMNDDLKGILIAHRIAKQSYRKTKQNVILAFSFNGIGIPLAMIGLLTPFHAMIAMVLSVTTILANSFLGGHVKLRSRRFF